MLHQPQDVLTTLSLRQEDPKGLGRVLDQGADLDPTTQDSTEDLDLHRIGGTRDLLQVIMKMIMKRSQSQVSKYIHGKMRKL